VPSATEDQLIFDLHCLQRRTARKKFRREILDAWDNCCAYCGSDRAYTLDHVQPKAKGGPTRRNNLVACCATCNIQKSDTEWMLFHRAQSFWSIEREMQILQWVNQGEFATEEARQYHELCQTKLILPEAN
jgi:HNH endonuclease